MRIRYTRKALADIAGILAYIAQDSPAAARSLALHLERLIARLAYTPELGQLADLKGLRRIPAGRYPYVIFYQVVPGREIVVHHVRHGARKPWTGSD